MEDTHVANLSPTGFKVLLALAEYRFLTAPQLIEIGVAKDRGYLGQVLTSLLSVRKKQGAMQRQPKEIGELDFGVLVGRGRLPRVYFLTARGAELIATIDPNQPPARYPRRVVRYQNDYHHRIATVDFHIALRAWANEHSQQLTWVRQYFDWTGQRDGAQPHTETRIKLTDRNINPDTIFKLSDEATERVFCVEIVNGMDTGRVVKQMRNYCLGLDDGRINKSLNLGDRAVRLLFVFEHERLLNLVQKAAKKERWLGAYAPHFFLKSMDDVQTGSFLDGWAGVDDGSRRKLF